ncbi:hypothetical protein CLPU_3c02800 [Gottschalkia purinilytica]|uniref:Uncharacterized protein n=1 Tax=Gottschalkia purinilytica TaxID=1503 RepID=A0A0L0WDK6_GOTPU|nr:hypothetical protein [Gottschalkia purinilytica]KNF09500.1 hypothetical protein CLPU_3c02800 [Gottschalkia purinilytica]
MEDTNINLPTDDFSHSSGSFNNNFLVFIPVLLFASNFNKNNTRTRSNTLNGSKKNNILAISDMINKISKSISIENVNDSIGTLKKIGPYFPEPIVEKLNSFIFTYEKMNKVVDLINFVSETTPSNPIVSSQSLSSKDRFNSILLTLKDDIPEEKIKNIKPLVNIVANFDKYKGMLGAVTTLFDSSKSKGNSLDGMIDMIKPMLGDNAETADKMKDMMQMVEILSALSSSDDNDNDNNNNNENDNSKNTNVDNDSENTNIDDDFENIDSLDKE